MRVTPPRGLVEQALDRGRRPFGVAARGALAHLLKLGVDRAQGISGRDDEDVFSEKRSDAFMLAATPLFDSHYLVDMIAGTVVAIASLWVSNRVVTGKARWFRAFGRVFHGDENLPQLEGVASGFGFVVDVTGRSGWERSA